MARVRSRLLLGWCVDLLISGASCALVGRTVLHVLAPPGLGAPLFPLSRPWTCFRTCSIGGTNGAVWNTVVRALRSSDIVPQSAQLFLGYFAYVNSRNFL